MAEHRALHDSTAEKLSSLELRLRMQGIRPLDADMVHNHMRHELETAPKMTPGYHMLSAILPPVLGTIYVACFCAMIIGAISAMFGNQPWGFLLTVSALGLIFLLDWVANRVHIRGPATWVVGPWVGCQHNRVNEMALRVTDRMPNATLVTHTLWQNEAVLDPVLEIRDSDESAYLAIWDEHRVIALAEHVA